MYKCLLKSLLSNLGDIHLVWSCLIISPFPFLNLHWIKMFLSNGFLSLLECLIDILNLKYLKHSYSLPNLTPVIICFRQWPVTLKHCNQSSVLCFLHRRYFISKSAPKITRNPATSAQTYSESTHIPVYTSAIVKSHTSPILSLGLRKAFSHLVSLFLLCFVIHLNPFPSHLKCYCSFPLQLKKNPKS